MRAVIPGDLVFSFQGTYIRAIGLIQSFAYSLPKPAEFGGIGANWANTGWCVNVNYHHLDNQIRPVDHIELLASHLPERYSPLQKTGRGNQSVYLTIVPSNLADQLIQIIGGEATRLRDSLNRISQFETLNEEPEKPTLELWEEEQVRAVYEDSSLSSTEKESIVVARRGQGLFKARVNKIEYRCRVTKVDQIQHLVASHIKPWRQCKSSDERLDGSNGLLLTPSIDHLFDRGFKSFDNQGALLVSPVAHSDSINRMGIDVNILQSTGVLNSDQKSYMEHHRNEVFLSEVSGAR